MIDCDEKMIQDALEFWGQVELFDHEVKLDGLKEFVKDNEGKECEFAMAVDERACGSDLTSCELAERFARAKGWGLSDAATFSEGFAYRLCLGSLPVTLLARRIIKDRWEEYGDSASAENPQGGRVPLFEIIHNGSIIEKAAPTFSAWLYARRRKASSGASPALRSEYESYCRDCLSELLHQLNGGSLTMRLASEWMNRTVSQLLSKEVREQWTNSGCDFSCRRLIFRLDGDHAVKFQKCAPDSYFLSDIDWLAREFGGDEACAGEAPGKAFDLVRSYIDAGLPHEGGEGARVDLFESCSSAGKDRLAACYEDILLHARTPAGRWPSEHRLSLMQQFAVNAVAGAVCDVRRTESNIGEDCGLSIGNLFSVSGPPGTGKTTLLRDVVAAFVVERAFLLSESETPDCAFDDGHCSDGIHPRVYCLADDRINDFGILVCSSNNASVENVSKDMTCIHTCSKLIDGGVFENETEDADVLNYFGEAAKKQFEGASTADLRLLLSARLGNGPNVKAFCVSLSAVVNDMRGAIAPKFAVARKDFRDQYKRVHTLLNEYEGRSEQGSSGFLSWIFGKSSRLSGRRRGADESDPHRVLKSVVGDLTEGDNAARAAAHRANPVSTPDIDRERDRLFVLALEFMREFIISSRKLKTNYESLEKVLGGTGAKDERLESYMAELMQSLFLLTPVVSSTFASVARLFEHVRPEHSADLAPFGLLVVDEAGQAPPQAALGALARCRRAVVVGDRKQVSPIVASDFRILRSKWENRVGAALTHMEKSSVQLLADRRNVVGSYFGREGDWCGCPLLVHRRCQSPMYDIFNVLSYDDKMVNATPEEAMEFDEEGGLVSPYCLASSRWLNVVGAEGAGSKDHYVKAQGGKAIDLIRKSVEANGAADALGRIFVISPFKSVVDGFKEDLRNSVDAADRVAKDRLKRFCKERVGTIHSFQGKETDEVIFLLGCDESSPRAVDWVDRELVNVAVSRAKKRLYVVGDAAVWQSNAAVRAMKDALDFHWISECESMLDAREAYKTAPDSEEARRAYELALDRVIASVPDMHSFSAEDGFVDFPELPDGLREKMVDAFSRLGCESGLWDRKKAHDLFGDVLGDAFDKVDGLIMQGLCLRSIFDDGAASGKMRALRASDDMSACLLPLCKAAELFLRSGYFECLKKANPEWRCDKKGKPLRDISADEVFIGDIRRFVTSSRVLLAKLTEDEFDAAWWKSLAKGIEGFGKVRNMVCHGSRSRTVGKQDYDKLVGYLFGQESGNAKRVAILRDADALRLVFDAAKTPDAVARAWANYNEWKEEREKERQQESKGAENGRGAGAGSCTNDVGGFEVPVVELDGGESKSLKAILGEMMEGRPAVLERHGKDLRSNKLSGKVNERLAEEGYLDGSAGAWVPTKKGAETMGMFLCAYRGDVRNPGIRYRGDGAEAKRVLMSIYASSAPADSPAVQEADSVPEVFDWSEDAGTVPTVDDVFEQRPDLYDLFAERGCDVYSDPAAAEDLLRDAGYIEDVGDERRPTKKGADELDMVLRRYWEKDGEGSVRVGYRDIDKAEAVFRRIAEA